MYRCAKCNWFGEDFERVKVGPMSEKTCPKCASSTYNIPIDREELERREQDNEGTNGRAD